MKLLQPMAFGSGVVFRARLRQFLILGLPFVVVRASRLQGAAETAAPQWFITLEFNAAKLLVAKHSPNEDDHRFTDNVEPILRRWRVSLRIQSRSSSGLPK